jgi:hypothetical protein
MTADPVAYPAATSHATPTPLSQQDVGEHSPQPASAHAQVLAFWGEQIAWYDHHKRVASRLYQYLQVLVIVLGGLTPILLLVPDPTIPRWVQALPAALAAMLAGIIAINQWRENWLRFGVTAEMLKLERLKFTTRTTAAYSANLPDSEALDNFVHSLEHLTTTELADWRKALSSPPSLEKKT